MRINGIVWRKKNFAKYFLKKKFIPTLKQYNFLAKDLDLQRIRCRRIHNNQFCVQGTDFFHALLNQRR